MVPLYFIFDSVEAMDRVRNVQMFPTWIATGAYPVPSTLYCTFLHAMNWTHVYLTIESEVEGTYYGYLSKFVRMYLKDCGIQYWQFTCADPNDTCSTESIAQILRDFHSKTRGREM